MARQRIIIEWDPADPSNSSDGFYTDQLDQAVVRLAVYLRSGLTATCGEWRQSPTSPRLAWRIELTDADQFL